MFIERSTKGKEVTVVLRYAAAFYWLQWPTLVLTILAATATSKATNIAAALAWGVLLFFAVPYWPIIFKL